MLAAGVCVLLALELAHALVSSAALWGDRSTHRLPSSPLHTLLLTSFALSVTCVGLTLAHACAQIYTVHRAMSGAHSKEIYTLLLSLRAAGLLGSVCELALTALLVSYFGDAGPLSLASILTRGATCVLRIAIAPSEPLRWSSLLVAGGDHARPLMLGRAISLLRLYFLCCCQLDRRLRHYGEAEDVEVEAIVAAAAVQLLGSSPTPPASWLPWPGVRVLAGLEVMREAIASNPAQSWPPGVPISAELAGRCRTAVSLHHFAVGAYTGVLMDCGRLPILGFFCWARKQCSSCGKIPLLHSEIEGVKRAGGGEGSDAMMQGDNCWNGHRASFRHHVGRCNSQEILASRRARRAGETSYFVTQRNAPGCREIIIAIRGTELVSDLLTDALCTSEPLRPDDLGLEKSPAQLGYAFGGVLECARCLAAELLPLLKSTLSMAPSGILTYVHIVGHSLGGSTAALLALRLAAPLRGFGAAEVSAFCYNPMPILSRAALAAVGARANRDVLSFVFRDDFASRLSLARLLHLRERSAAALDNRCSHSHAIRAVRLICSLACRCLMRAGRYAPMTETWGRARALDEQQATARALHQSHPLGAANPSSETLVDGSLDIEGGGSLEEAVRIAESSTHEFPRIEEELYLAGQVVHVRGSPGAMELVAVSAYEFTHLNPTPNCLVDNVPWALQYELAKSLGYTFQAHAWDDAYRGTTSPSHIELVTEEPSVQQSSR